MLVIVALLFFWRDRISEKEEISQDFIEYADYCEKNTKPIKPGDSWEDLEVHIWYPVNIEKVEKNFKRDKKVYQRIEIAVACCGTFIWAYGKFLMDYILPL